MISRHRARRHLRRHHRRRRIRAHAAGIRTLIVVEGALVVLRGGERNRSRAVAEREERGFLALEEFLDHDLRAGGAKSALEHHVDGVHRLIEGLCNHDALAGGKAVRLHHDRCAMLAHVSLCRLRRGEALIGRGRNIVGAADVLGEALRAFQSGGGFGRTECLDPGGFEIVDDAGAERRLRPDHDKVDALVLAEGDDCGSDRPDRAPRIRPPARSRHCPARNRGGRPVGSPPFSMPGHARVRQIRAEGCSFVAKTPYFGAVCVA